MGTDISQSKACKIPEVNARTACASREINMDKKTIIWRGETRYTGPSYFGRKRAFLRNGEAKALTSDCVCNTHYASVRRQETQWAPVYYDVIKTQQPKELRLSTDVVQYIELQSRNRGKYRELYMQRSTAQGHRDRKFKGGEFQRG